MSREHGPAGPRPTKAAATAFESLTPEERSRAVFALYCATGNVRTVGDMLGVSGERVRQLVRRATPDHVMLKRRHGAPDPLRLMRVIRASGPDRVSTVTEAADRCGISASGVRQTLDLLGVARAVTRLLRLRRRARGRELREALADGLRRAAVALGRVPTMADMNAHLAGLRSHSRYVEHFGSMSAAIASAGLNETPRGTRGHVHGCDCASCAAERELFANAGRALCVDLLPDVTLRRATWGHLTPRGRAYLEAATAAGVTSLTAAARSVEPTISRDTFVSRLHAIGVHERVGRLYRLRKVLGRSAARERRRDAALTRSDRSRSVRRERGIGDRVRRDVTVMPREYRPAAR